LDAYNRRTAPGSWPQFGQSTADEPRIACFDLLSFHGVVCRPHPPSGLPKRHFGPDVGRIERRVVEAADPTRSMSRANLAEAVCAWLWHGRGIEVALDANYIAKLERGAVRRTGKLYQGGLRAVLGVATDRELGMGTFTIRSQPSELWKAQSLT
jgi:hypothetical protein